MPAATWRLSPPLLPPGSPGHVKAEDIMNARPPGKI